MKSRAVHINTAPHNTIFFNQTSSHDKQFKAIPPHQTDFIGQRFILNKISAQQLSPSPGFGGER